MHLNQSLPTINPPPGFSNFEMPNNMNSFDGGHNFGMYPPPPPPQLTNQFPPGMGTQFQSFRSSGRLKFFDEVQNYGFLVVDGDSSDLFVHYDDLKDAKLSRDILRQAKTNYFLQFSFDIAFYSGKYKESKKAVNLKLLKIEKLGIIN